VPVYPFENAAAWLVANRYKHLVEAVEPWIGRLPAPDAQIVRNRLRGIGVWMRARTAVLVLLYLSLVVAALGFLSQYVGGLEATSRAVGRVAGISSGVTGTLLTAAYFFLTRLLGKLEVDVVLVLGLQTLMRVPEDEE